MLDITYPCKLDIESFKHLISAESFSNIDNVSEHEEHGACLLSVGSGHGGVVAGEVDECLEGKYWEKNWAITGFSVAAILSLRIFRESSFAFN